MAPQYCQDDKRCSTTKELARDLGEDDVAAVCSLYPPEGTWTSSEPEQKGCALAPTSSNQPGGAYFVLVALGGVALLTARARRRSADVTRPE